MELHQIPFHKPEFTFVDSIAELEECQDIYSGFEPNVINGATIGLTDDGLVAVGSKEMPITKAGFRGLCSALGIPDPFAKRIPFDLLQFNIQRLAKMKKELAVFQSPKNGHISFITKPRTAETVMPVLDLFKGVMEGIPELEVYRIEVSELGAVAEFPMGDLPAMEHRAVGDVSKFGWQLTASECAAYAAAAKFIALVLSCTNGMVAPRTYSTVKARGKGEASKRVAGFLRRLNEDRNRIDKFINVYNYVAETPSLVPDNPGGSKLWNGVKRVTGDADVADAVLNLTEEKRKLLRTLGKVHRAAMNGAMVPDMENDYTVPVITESWWKTLNRVTEAANQMSGSERRRMQELAGKTIHQLSLELDLDSAS